MFHLGERLLQEKKPAAFLVNAGTNSINFSKYPLLQQPHKSQRKRDRIQLHKRFFFKKNDNAS